MKRSSSARKLRRLYTYSFANEKGMMAIREFNEVPHASSRSRNRQIALYDSGLHFLRLIPDICILSSFTNDIAQSNFELQMIIASSKCNLRVARDSLSDFHRFWLIRSLLSRPANFNFEISIQRTGRYSQRKRASRV